MTKEEIVKKLNDDFSLSPNELVFYNHGEGALVKFSSGIELGYQ